MRPNCCHVSLAFVLKFLNFLQAFVGLSIVLYSLWMLDQWNHHIPISPPSSAPSPDSSSLFLSESAGVSDQIAPLNLAVDLVSGFDGGFGLDSNSFKLPAPWFVYSFMGYTLLVTVLILLEAALVGFIAIDRRWEKDLPFDPTGELQSLRSFIEENIDICKWIGIVVVTVQALSLLVSVILRATISTRKADVDGEDDYEARGRIREPLLNPQSSLASGSTKGDGRGAHSDIWSSRIRDKYGLNSNDKHNATNSTNSRQ